MSRPVCKRGKANILLRDGKILYKIWKVRFFPFFQGKVRKIKSERILLGGEDEFSRWIVNIILEVGTGGVKISFFFWGGVKNFF